MSQHLLNAYRRGEEGVAEQLIEECLPLVRSIVGRLAVQLPPEVDREDLEEVGILGLLSAVHSYDPERGAAFSTYAYIAIRGAVLDELRRLDVLPRARRDGVRAYEAACRELVEKLGREPTFLEVQDQLDLTAPELEELLRVRAIADAFGRGLGESSTGVAPETFLTTEQDDPVASAQANEAKERLAAALATLPQREQEVVILYFHGGLLLREIGQVLNITEGRVSQILQHSLVLLNHRLGGPMAREE